MTEPKLMTKTDTRRVGKRVKDTQERNRNKASTREEIDKMSSKERNL
jgi:hypothetical protein